MRRTSSLLLIVSLAGACAPQNPDASLRAFSDCEGLGDYMRDMALQEVLYDWRWEPGGFGMAEYSMGAKDDSSGAAPPDSYSTTNLQEQGVDEADLVKTDGRHLFTLSGAHLVISLAWPHDEAQVLSTVRIDGVPDGLYLLGDEDEGGNLVPTWAVVLSQVRDVPQPRSGVAPDLDRRDGLVLATLVDVADPADPRVVRETYTVGELKTSRRIGDRLYVVTYQDIRVGGSASNAREAEEQVRVAEPSAWLPKRSDHLLGDPDWTVDDGTACDCDQVYASEREGGTYLTTVLSLDLADPRSEFAGESVVGEAETVYASAEAIYVGDGEYTEGPFPSLDGALSSYLHKFDISDADAVPAYVATAQVNGVLNDQFSMSEYEGVLRVATTTGESTWADDSQAAVHTLREEGGRFELLDSLDGLGVGEQIYAVRFTQDKGYVVTYRQVDPLFTLDLSDPADIRLGGQLEMPGWSDYLHPMDEDHLLAVGMDEDWRLQVSLFDVSDMANPVLADREALDAWGSESQYEHHAFNYFADQDALALPAWSMGDETVLEVLEASSEGLSFTGEVDQQALAAAFGGIPTWCAPVRRSVIMDRVVYAVSNMGYTVTTLDDPTTVLQTVPYTGLDPCEGRNDYWY